MGCTIFNTRLVDVSIQVYVHHSQLINVNCEYCIICWFFFQLWFCISFCLLSPYWMLCSRFFPSFNHNQIKTLNNDYTITYSSVIYHHVCSVVLCCAVLYDVHALQMSNWISKNKPWKLLWCKIDNCPAKFWAVWRNKNKKRELK